MQLTDDEYQAASTAADYLKNKIGYNNTINELVERLTCSTCEQRSDCEYAFDPYNLDGDCLRDK